MEKLIVPADGEAWPRKGWGDEGYTRDGDEGGDSHWSRQCGRRSRMVRQNSLTKKEGHGGAKRRGH